MLFEMESPTLKNVLIELFEKVGVPIYSAEKEEIQGDFKIYLNGVECDDLADGNVLLKNEDEVEVTMVILGRG